MTIKDKTIAINGANCDCKMTMTSREPAAADIFGKSGDGYE